MRAKIIIIEDDPVIRKELQTLLERKTGMRRLQLMILRTSWHR